MPLPTRYKYKKMQHDAAMGRKNKKQKVPKFIPAPNINPLTVSPNDSYLITSTNKKLLINNLPLTIIANQLFVSKGRSKVYILARKIIYRK